MSRFVGNRLQIILVVLLFLGSIAVLLYSTWTTLALPQRELEARNQLPVASKEMAEKASEIADSLQGDFNPDRDELNQKLRVITNNVLEAYAGIEGGFFLALDDRFTGYAYPTSKHAPSDLVRHEPPPLEAPIIRKLAQACLDRGASSFRIDDVELSRVVIYSEPVGKGWPASLATWLMVRLTGPEQLERQLRRSELSSYLALGGVLLSLILTWNLVRTLKRQRREEDRLRDQLRHAEHLAGLGRLLAGVAHEIRNPLAAIRSTVQLWQRQPETVRAPESLEAVVHSVDRLANIVSRLLLFARMDNAERRPVDMNQLLAESLDLVKAQAAEQGVRLQNQFSAHLPMVSGSASALGQVILNLVSNALQAMPAGGCLTIATAHHADSRQVEILVSDTGPGISTEDQRHLFEPFFTTRPDGTGLGLALCREIVGNHGGTIEYLVREGCGTTFRILMPIAKD